MLRSIPPFCRALILILGLSAVIGLFMQGLWAGTLLLSGREVLEGFQVWRLFTYPFVTQIFGALSAGLVLWFFGSELEQIVHTGKLATMMMASIVIGGVLFLLIDRDGIMGGPSTISIFILAGFAYMWPMREISVMGMFNLKAWVIALIFFVIAIIPANGTRLDYSPSQIFAPTFAAISALIMFHIAFRQYSFGGAAMSKITNSIGSSVMRSGFARKTGLAKEPEIDLTSKRAIERRIDEILDKIAAKGMKSLSEEEKEFLLTYSKR